MIICHTEEVERVARRKIAISLDGEVLEIVDRLVEMNSYPNRSRAIEGAIIVADKIEKRKTLLRELKKLDPAEEMAFAEEFLEADMETWPEY